MKITRISTALAVALTFPLAGCAGVGGLGTLGEILGAAMGGQQQGQVRAEVQGVDTRRQFLSLRTEDGRSGNIRYDQNTRVVYQQQQYPVSALERGDIVVVQVQEDRQGNPYASRIDVEQSVSQRSGQSGNVQVIEGRAGQIDHQRGTFQLQTSQGYTVLVSLPYNPPSQTLDRFHRLRSGDWVSIEATAVSNNRVELHRFR